MKKEEKKRIKAEAKLRKKENKASIKPEASLLPGKKKGKTYEAIRFAEGVKGIIYLALAVSVIATVILGQTGVIFTLEDIIENLILAKAGKIILILIAFAFFIYGLKQLRILR